MKKTVLGLLLLCVLSISCFPQNKIIDYDESHKNAVMEIVFQDAYKFFTGSAVVTKGLMPAELFESKNRKGMEAILENPLKIKKVLVDSGRVIGFVEFYKTHEPTLESMKCAVESQGKPFDENQILKEMPHLKRTDAECEFFVKIESLAVDKNCRGKGHGRALIRSAIDSIKHLWPTITQVQLDVNANNEVAKKLYESEGFVKSSVQPMLMVFTDKIQYEKEIK